MINDKLKLRGDLKITLNGETVRELKNLVVDTGLNFICDRMEGVTEGVMSHMAIGSDTTPAAAGDTALISELGRVALSGTTVTDNAIEYTASFGAGTGTGAVTEAGIFNDPTAGTMLARTVFSVVNKGAADTMGITWTITLSAS